MEKKIAVVALGGNAITREFEEGDIHQQFANTRSSLLSVIALIHQGYNIVITHGNGPQVGNAMIRVEETRNQVPPLPLGIIVADLQGGMGYMIEQCLQNKLHDRGIQKKVVTIITQAIADPDDPSIINPTKFVGPFYSKEQIKELIEKRGYIIKEDKGRGYRRVVASPVPKGIVEGDIIRNLVCQDIIVIAAGGGGIPVYYDNRGWLEGIDGVVDKDLASAVLATEIAAKKLVILTGVEKVAVGYKTPQQKDLSHLTVAEAKKYLLNGEFPAGSMGPKIQAAINFLESGGKEVLITSIEKGVDALERKNGTIISMK